MTIKPVEPLKFKGNKTWYLHKLSEKGADAIKCDFPNGDDTFTKTTIQAAIEELATNGGGGGSAESLIPKRVIYINPDKETVAGECYPTFTAAKAYMETCPEQKFCVELPAGEITEQITLSEQWDICGNNTILKAPLKSKMTLSTQWNYRTLISDCVIAEGFETIETQSEADMLILPFYTLNNCMITQIENDEDEPDIYPRMSIIVTNGGNINITSCSNNGLKQCVLRAIGVTIQRLVANVGQYTFLGCSVIGDITSPNTSHGNAEAMQYIGCDFAYFSEIEVACHSIYSSQFNMATFKGSDDVDLINCSGLGKVSAGRDCNIKNSSVTLLPIDGTIAGIFSICRSKVEFISKEGDTSTQTINTVVTDAVSDVTFNNKWTITYNKIRNNIMYSTDGGVTMSKDSTGATHYGITIDGSVDSYEVTNYMWFPMPE